MDFVSVTKKILKQAELDELLSLHERFLAGKMGGKRAVLQYFDLSGLQAINRDLRQADFTGSNFVGANLAGTDLMAAILFGCNFNNTNLRNANLARADLRGSYLAGAILSGANLEDADMRQGLIMGTEHNAKAHRSNQQRGETVLSGADVSGANLSRVQAKGADFSDANLTGAKMKDSDFTGSNFKNADVSNADMTGADISYADVSNAVMSDTIMDAVEKKGAKSAAASREIKKLENPQKEIKTLLAAHAKWLSTSGQEGQQFDLSEYDLSKVENINQFSFIAVKAQATLFVKQDLFGTDMQSSNFDGSDFRGADMSETDIRGSTFRNAHMSRVTLSRAKMCPLKIRAGGKEKLLRVNLDGANLRYATIVGADMRDILLTCADLSYAKLINCDLRRADLTGSIMENVIIRDCKLDDAKMAGHS